MESGRTSAKASEAEAAEDGCEEEVTLLRARKKQAAKEEIAKRQSATELEILAEKNLEIMDLQESLRVATIENMTLK